MTLTTPMVERWCPLCNQVTPTQRQMVDMFVIVTCENCGFVHRVTDHGDREEFFMSQSEKKDPPRFS